MKSRPPACRLLEPLETRSLLATVFWDGGAGDELWHSPANWSGDVVPGASDDVIVSVSGLAVVRFTTGTATVRTLRTREDFRVLGGMLTATVNVRVEAGALTVAGGTLRAPSKAEVMSAGQLRLMSGVIDGAGKVQVWGSMTWAGGTLGGAGIAYIEDNAVLTVEGSTPRLERRLINRGELHWTGPRWTIASGYLRNDPSGVMTIAHPPGMTGTPRIESPDGATRFYHLGRLEVAEPPPTTTVIAPARRAELAVRTVTQAGSIVVAQSGMAHFTRGGVHVGRFEIELSAGFAFSGSTWYTSSATFATLVHNAEVRFEGGSHTVKRARDWGAITVTLADNALVHFAEYQQLDDLLIWHGTIAGPANVVVRDAFYWNGGSMLGTGRTIVQSGANAGIWTVAGPAGPTLRLSRDLELHSYTPLFDAQLVLIGAHLILGAQSDVMWRAERVYGAGDARVINHADLDMQWDVAMTGVRLENHGRLEIGGGSVQVSGIGTMVIDSGALVLSHGRLKVVGDYVKTGGTIESTFVHFDSGEMLCGRVVATGRATLGGSVRAVFAANAEAQPWVGDRFVFVWAGQRVGQFGSVSHTTVPGIAASLEFNLHAAILAIEPD